ncbi:calcium-binding protein [Tritonibacter litoralis]|nr:calcium-binding protein [Tritonibacter litoralis]
MAVVTFRPTVEQFDILSTATPLFFLVQSTDTILTNTGDTLRLEYNGTSLPAARDAFITATGDFTADSMDDWTISSVTYGRAEKVIFTIKELALTGRDILDADSGNELLEILLAGDDTITLEPGDARAIIEGFEGDDRIILNEQSQDVFGALGIDTVVIDSRIREAEFGGDTFAFSVETGPDNRDFLIGVEAIEFRDQSVALSVANDGGDVLTGNTVDGLAHDLLFGGDADDRLVGLSGNDWLFGEGGTDTLVGGGGRDNLNGGAGNDNLLGARGLDTLSGGSGDDVLNGGGGADRLFGGSGQDTLIGGGQSDRLVGARGADRLQGGGGNDTVLGGSSRDTLLGNNGRDTLRGGGGNDSLNGGNANDALFGGAGSDRIDGGRGNDRLTGNGGNDTFVFSQINSGRDRITDFTIGRDQIEITAGDIDFDDLQFSAANQGAQINFGQTTIIVEDASVSDLNDSDNFLF